MVSLDTFLLHSRRRQALFIYPHGNRPLLSVSLHCNKKKNRILKNLFRNMIIKYFIHMPTFFYYLEYFYCFFTGGFSATLHTWNTDLD